MLFGKTFFTTFTLAAMAITQVASVPVAQPDVSLVEKRTASDYMSTCYNEVKYKCDSIEHKIDGAGGVINVDLAADIKADLTVIVDLIVKVVADIKVEIKAGISVGDIQACGNTFILLVNLLVAILIKIGNACQPAAISILAAVVLQLKINIQLCATVIIGGINGLLGLILGLLLNILLKLKIDINACISVFVGACAKFI